MSANKFATIHYDRKYKSLDVNTKTVTTRKIENYRSVFVTVFNDNLSGDFGDNGFNTTARGTYLDNFCKLEIILRDISIVNTTGVGILEFQVSNIGTQSVTPTVQTDYVFGNGKLIIGSGTTYNVSGVTTFYNGSYWLFRVTFQSNKTALTTQDSFGCLTLFYRRVDG